MGGKLLMPKILYKVFSIKMGGFMFETNNQFIVIIYFAIILVGYTNIIKLFKNIFSNQFYSPAFFNKDIHVTQFLLNEKYFYQGNPIEWKCVPMPPFLR